MVPGSVEKNIQGRFGWGGSLDFPYKGNGTVAICTSIDSDTFYERAGKIFQIYGTVNIHPLASSRAF